jgi:hypothetical protein
MCSKRAFLACAGVGLGLLAGCVSYQVDDHSYQFNEATGSLNLRLLLLNAVRASKDYPLQFSKISAYSGKGAMSSARISASMPIKIPSNGTLSPSVDLTDGISKLDLIDLNTEEAQQALRKTLPLRVYQYYTEYSGNRSYVTPVLLMVEYVSMPRALFGLIGKYVQERCRLYLSEGAERLKLERFAHNRYACIQLRKIERECGGDRKTVFDRALMAHPDARLAVLQNRLTSECEHKAFVSGTLHLAIVGGSVGPAKQSASKGRPPRGGKGGKDEQAPSSVQKGAGVQFNIYATESSKGGDDKEKGEPDKEEIILPFYEKGFADRCMKAKPRPLCRIRRELGTAPLALEVKIQLRSPERMVRFLGDLIAAQAYGSKRFDPILIDPIREEEYFLLQVKRGVPPPGAAVVSVVAPDGETIYVPRRDPDAPKKDISLETLAIVSDILNGAVSKKAYPPVTTLTVTSP